MVTAPVVEEPAATPSRVGKPPAGLRLQDEAALLADVQGALRGGQATVALAKLESYDRRFPAGMLRSEADAARVFALCSAGRVEKARAAAARFVQRYPSAPVTARVQAACK
jgi:outer membrane protein assembly factor BamD (BamD/ComL family)